MEGKRATIKDVAIASGVTPQTVSRVFRGKGYVSADTRIKVLDAASKLKYVPNSAAISLRTGAKKSIAVVFDSLINIYFSVMVDYLQKELQLNGYNIQTIFVPSHTINDATYRDALSLGVSAIISFLEPEDSLSGTVRDFGVPLIILGRRSELEEFDYITTDDVEGGALAAQKLMRSGCNSFAFLAGGFGMTCVRDRLCGFSAALKESGFGEPIIIDSTHGVRAAMEKFLEECELPDGIFCFSDMLAYELLNILHAGGHSDVKVVGYDNIQADIAMPIDLSSVGVDKPAFVKRIVELILDKIEGRAPGRIAKRMSVELHDGETA